jgi:uncharacterized protein (TIGR02597 family)
MKTKLAAITAATILALGLQPARAAQVVGFNKVAVPASSDVRLTVPFTQKAEGEFTVSGVSGSTVNVSEAVSGSYANSYYVRFTTGNGQGLWATITANNSNSFTVAAADAAAVAYAQTGDKVRVYKHQTLGSVFPAALYNLSFINGTSVLIYDNNIAAMAQNKSSSKAASYTTSGGGRWSGSGVNSNTILKPETLFILRNSSSKTLTMVTLGKVADYPVSMLIAPAGDLVIGSGYPVPVVLKNSGLGGTTNRQVMFYDSSATGQNKSASKIASYTTSGGGRWTGSGVTGNELIKPSESVTFRLPAGETGAKVTIVKPY